MKNLIYFACLLSLNVLGLETNRIGVILNRMVDASGEEYIDAREQVLKLGNEALPELSRRAVSSEYHWRHQLAARICYERILKDREILAIRSKNWKQLIDDAIPRYQPTAAELAEKENAIKNNKPYILLKPGDRLIPLTGPEHLVYEDMLREFRGMGTWYYFVELNWKRTGETAWGFVSTRFHELWCNWCMEIVLEQPEEIWLFRALGDRIETASFTGSNTVASESIYAMLLKEDEPATVPILLERFDEYVAAESGSSQPGSDVFAYTTWWKFVKFLDFADSRSVSELEATISRHPNLEPLREKLDEVRKRPAPIGPDPREVFRIGQEPVVVPK